MGFFGGVNLAKLENPDFWNLGQNGFNQNPDPADAKIG